jgi:hypothetical protein
MASTLAVAGRCGPFVRPSSGRRMHAAPAAKAPLVMRLARPSLLAPRAFYRGPGSCGGGSGWRGWSPQDEAAMKVRMHAAVAAGCCCERMQKQRRCSSRMHAYACMYACMYPCMHAHSSRSPQPTSPMHIHALR